MTIYLLHLVRTLEIRQKMKLKISLSLLISLNFFNYGWTQNCNVIGACMSNYYLGFARSSDNLECLTFCQENPFCNWYTFDTKVHLCFFYENCFDM